MYDAFSRTQPLQRASDLIEDARRYSPCATTAVGLPVELRRDLQDACESTAPMVKGPAAIAAADCHVRPIARGHGPATVAIKGFRVLSKLGEGGMATAYLAERESDRERLVLKVFVAHEGYDVAMLDRFILEHAAIARVDHPGIVRIYDQGITDDLLYIAMEHLEGRDLKQRIERGLSAQQAVEILRGLLSALAAVHGCGIVHRDIKPANVMFRQDGTPVLLDFGIAKNLTHAASSVLTMDGQIMGSPSYISPEQVCGEPCDGRSDLYSLGMVFYEMLTGRKPYVRHSVHEVLSDHVSSPLPRLPEAFSVYQPFIAKLAAKAPGDRYAGAAEALAVLKWL